jgi:hypothetical protein
MFLRRLASSVLALSLLGGIAAAAPSSHRFAQPPPAAGIGLRDEGPIATGDRGTADAMDRVKLRAVLAERRAANLALFRAYRNGGVYPHNFISDGKLNVWMDDEGRLCAAATIIANSGNVDLAMSVPADDNFLRLADVTDGPLMDWMLTSGFTQDEIAAIQEPFMGRMEPMPMPEPEPDARRLAEDDRLRKRYAQVDRMLVKGAKKSLDAAVDRLLDENPTLAASLLAMD